MKIRAVALALALVAALPAHAIESPASASLGEESPPPATPLFTTDDSAIAMRRARSGTPLLMARINGVAIELGLDTGAGLSVISESVAERVGARAGKEGAPKVKDSLGREIPGRLARVSLELGAMRHDDLPVLVLPDDRLQARLLGMFTLFSFDGLVGWHAIAPARTTIDFDSRTIRFSRPSASCAERKIWSRAFKPIVQAIVGGRSVDGFLDTGARASWGLQGREAWRGAFDTLPGAGLIAGAGGAEVRIQDKATDVLVETGGRSTRLESLAFRKGPPDAPHDITLGMDVLGTGIVVLDLACGDFTLAPGAPSAASRR